MVLGLGCFGFWAQVCPLLCLWILLCPLHLPLAAHGAHSLSLSPPGPHFVAVNNKNEIVVTDFHNHSVKVSNGVLCAACHVLCAMSCVPCAMCRVLCPMSHVLHAMCRMPCSATHVLYATSRVMCPLHCVPCPMCHVPCPMYCVLCPVSHILHPMSHVPVPVPCPMFRVPCAVPVPGSDPPPGLQRRRRVPVQVRLSRGGQWTVQRSHRGGCGRQWQHHCGRLGQQPHPGTGPMGPYSPASLCSSVTSIPASSLVLIPSIPTQPHPCPHSITPIPASSPSSSRHSHLLSSSHHSHPSLIPVLIPSFSPFRDGVCGARVGSSQRGHGPGPQCRGAQGDGVCLGHGDTGDTGTCLCPCRCLTPRAPSCPTSTQQRILCMGRRAWPSPPTATSWWPTRATIASRPIATCSSTAAQAGATPRHRLGLPHGTGWGCPTHATPAFTCTLSGVHGRAPPPAPWQGCSRTAGGPGGAEGAAAGG